jgi:hypothetical protein
MCFFNPHFLMPAMDAADSIRMHRKRDVLMHTAVAPEDVRKK